MATQVLISYRSAGTYLHIFLLCWPMTSMYACHSKTVSPSSNCSRGEVGLLREECARGLWTVDVLPCQEDCVNDSGCTEWACGLLTFYRVGRTVSTQCVLNGYRLFTK